MFQSSCILPEQGAFRRKWQVLFKECKAYRSRLTPLTYIPIGHAVLAEYMNSRRAQLPLLLTLSIYFHVGKTRSTHLLRYEILN